MTDSSHPIVLVVGGGPTGLMTALVLARMGVRPRIIDAAADRAGQSRALVVHARSLELLAKLGLADELVARGRKGLRTHLIAESDRVGELELADLGERETAFGFLLFVSQAHTEAVLEAALTREGIAVERCVQLTALEQDDDGVEVTLQGAPGGRYRYVVGCDGAHSTVRKQLGLRFDGDAYAQEFLLGDVAIDADLDPNTLSLFLKRDGVAALFPLGDPAPWRVLTVAPEDSHGAADDDALSLDELRTALERIAGRSLPLRDPKWLSRFRLHHRGVDRYRVGRVFVAGDAAHIHSPAGGQGMNTGLQDGFNLAWKLALTVRGFGTAALLASYHAERYPVGQFLLKFTDRLFRAATSRAPLLRFARSALAPLVLPRAMRVRALRRRMLHTVTQLGIRYGESPAIAATSGPLALRPGDRLPDGVLVGDPRSLAEHTSALRYHLLVIANADEPVDRRSWIQLRHRYEDLLEVVHIGRTEIANDLTMALGPELQARLALQAAAVILVRPDGHVAALAPADDLTAVVEGLDRWLVPPRAV